MGIMRFREYSNYDEYLTHQSAKTLAVKDGTCTELGHFALRLERFFNLFKEFTVNLPCRAVCLGSRRGEEVSALRLLGFDAIGLDIVAFPPLVHFGDMHDIPLWDESVSFVFSNSIDHALDPEKVAEEVKRILIPGGFAMFHLQIGKWSDEVANQMDSSEDFTGSFAGWTFHKDEPLSEYGMGPNWLVLVQKPC